MLNKMFTIRSVRKTIVLCREVIVELLTNFLDYCRPLARITSSLSRRCSLNSYSRRSSSLQFKLFRLFIYSYLLATFLRTVIFGLALQRKGSVSVEMLQAWEPTLWQIKAAFEPLVNSTTLFCLSLLPLYIAYLQYLVDFKVAKVAALKLLGDLYLLNSDHFFTLNFRFLLRSVDCSSLKKAVNSLRQIWSCEGRRKILLSHKGALPSFPEVSHKTRVQVALLAATFELLFTFMVIPGSTMATLLLFGHFFFFGARSSKNLLFNKAHSQIAFLRLTVDLAFTVYASALASLALFYCFLSFTLIFFVHCKQLSLLNEELKVAHYRKKGSLHRYVLLIGRYRAQHSAIYRHFYLAKVQLIDSILLVMVLSNLLVNIFSIGMFAFERGLTPYDKLLLVSIVFFEVMVVGYVCQLMLTLSRRLHSSAGYLHLATFYLRRPSDKLKMMSYYEVVHSRNRLCFGVGSLIKIDKEQALSSVFLYTSYVLYASKMVRKQFIFKF